MSNKKIFLILILFIFLANSVSAFAMTTADKENNYKAAVLQLETYLESYGNSSMELAGVAGAFAELRGYEQSNFLGYYVSVLMKIADEEYDYELYTALNMLERNTEFNAYLKDALKGSSIGSVEELVNYATAREYEHNGDENQALESYGECLNFFDSAKRYADLLQRGDAQKYDAAMALLKAGDYAGAYFKFSEIPRFNDSKELLDSIVNQLGYTPTSPEDNLNPATNLIMTKTKANSICLAWIGSPYTENYEVYYRQSGGSEWSFAGITENTEMAIEHLQDGMAYDFQVIACIGRIKTEGAVLQNQKVASRSPASDYEVGKYVTFGSYPQTTEGTDNTPIEWLVLEKHGDKALLISRFILDCQPYNANNSPDTWERSTLRAWLNNTFICNAFSNDEQDSIIVSSIDNSKIQGSLDWDTYDEKATFDKVFLLSVNEVYKYFSNDEARKCVATDYAIQEGVATGGWWLRSHRKDNGFKAGMVTGGGALGLRHVKRTEYGVRPALWINLDAGIF